jgi:LysR family pca operon transcriptional activator
VDEELDLLAEPGLSSLAIGTLPAATAGVLPGALARLKALYPDIRIRLQQGRTEDLRPLLAAGEIDLIVGRLYEPAVPDGLLRETLWMEPIAILARAGHALFAIPQVTAEPLRGCDLIPTVRRVDSNVILSGSMGLDSLPRLAGDRT